MLNVLKEFLTAPRLRVTNFISCGLIVLGIILRFVVSDEEDEGVGGTPTFLYIVQFLLTLLFVTMLICGELHKSPVILRNLPLLMSRSGRGVIMLFIALPVTNFYDFITVLIALVAALIGILNICIGYHDGNVELKYADEGVPEDYGASTQN